MPPLSAHAHGYNCEERVEVHMIRGDSVVHMCPPCTHMCHMYPQVRDFAVFLTSGAGSDADFGLGMSYVLSSSRKRVCVMHGGIGGATGGVVILVGCSSASFLTYSLRSSSTPAPQPCGSTYVVAEAITRALLRDHGLKCVHPYLHLSHHSTISTEDATWVCTIWYIRCMPCLQVAPYLGGLGT